MEDALVITAWFVGGLAYCTLQVYLLGLAVHNHNRKPEVQFRMAKRRMQRALRLALREARAIEAGSTRRYLYTEPELYQQRMERDERRENAIWNWFE